MWRDLVVSLSLANLIYLRIWAEVLDFQPTDAYWAKTPPTPPHLIALMINVLLLGALLWFLILRMRRSRSNFFWLAPPVFLIILLTLINSLRTLVDTNPPLFPGFLRQRIFSIGIAVAIIMIVALIFGGRRVLRPILMVLIVMSPFVPIAFAQAFYRIAHYDPAQYADRPTGAPMVPPPSSRHIVWVIFDEWDQNLTFTERYSRVHLPEIDRFRQQALYASDAGSPANATDWSIPALITGRMVKDVIPVGPDDLQIWWHDGAPSRWSQEPNVFGRARLAGFNTAVVGWALPYCRVLNTSLSGCWWWASSNPYHSTGDTLWQIMPNQFRSLFESVYRSPFGQSLATKHHAAVYERLMKKALDVTTDRNFNLVMLHVPAPHPPYFFDSSSGRDSRGSAPVLGLFRSTQKGYLDELMLVDRSVGELRRALEGANEWGLTTILLTSDHPYRHRPALDGHPMGTKVPFLLKLAGQTAGAGYDARFNTVVTGDLLLAILRGELSSPEDVKIWLDANHTTN